MDFHCIEAYNENELVTKISYEVVRYFDYNIYKVLDCYELLEGGELFINYRDINRLLENNKVDKKERDFMNILNGYDIVELRFSRKC